MSEDTRKCSRRRIKDHPVWARVPVSWDPDVVQSTILENREFDQIPCIHTRVDSDAVPVLSPITIFMWIITTDRPAPKMDVPRMIHGCQNICTCEYRTILANVIIVIYTIDLSDTLNREEEEEDESLYFGIRISVC
jgi:hypothetical protein